MSLYPAHKNFAISTIATAPSPATSGTTAAFATGEGARMPAVPFNATVWAAGTLPTPANAEIVRITGISGDSITAMSRAQEGSTARTIVVGDQIMAANTALETQSLEGELYARRMLGSLVVVGHSYTAGTTQTDSGVSNVYQESLVSKLMGLAGIHEHNVVHLGIAGTRLGGTTAGFTNAPYGGWVGVAQFIVPNASVNVNAANDVIVNDPPTASVGAGLIVHGVNDVIAGYNSIIVSTWQTMSQVPFKNGLRFALSRMRAGLLFDSEVSSGSIVWDGAITFTGTWSDVASIVQNSGPAYKQSKTNTDSVTFTIPTNFTGGVVSINLVSQGGALAVLTGGTISANLTTAATITVNTTADFPQSGGQYVIQIDSEQILVTTAGQSGAGWLTSVARGYNGTVAATHAAGAAVFVPSNQTATWSNPDSGSFGTSGLNGGTVDNVGWLGLGAGTGGQAVGFTKRFLATAADAGKRIVCTFAGIPTTSGGDAISAFWFDSVSIEAVEKPPIVVAYTHHWMMFGAQQAGYLAQIANFNTAVDSVIAEFDGWVRAADTYTPFWKRNGVLANANLNNTTPGSVSFGWTANDASFTPSAGMLFSAGALSNERILITAVSGSFPNWTLTGTRAADGSTIGALASGTFFGPQQWMSKLDNVHLTNYGHAVYAEAIFSAFQDMLRITPPNLYQPALTVGNWSQGAQVLYPGCPDGYWLTPPCNQLGTATAIATGTQVAIPIYVSRTSILTGMGMITNGTNAAGQVRFGIYLPDASHARPGRLLQAFGSISNNATQIQQVGIYQILRPGWYWLSMVQQTAASTLRTMALGGLSFPAIPQPTMPASGTNLMANGYSQTGITGALADWGISYTAILNATGAPLMFYQLRSAGSA